MTGNTILKDEELKDTEKMIWDLYRAGVDAVSYTHLDVYKRQVMRDEVMASDLDLQAAAATARAAEKQVSVDHQGWLPKLEAGDVYKRQALSC